MSIIPGSSNTDALCSWIWPETQPNVSVFNDLGVRFNDQLSFKKKKKLYGGQQGQKGDNKPAAASETMAIQKH